MKNLESMQELIIILLKIRLSTLTRASSGSILIIDFGFEQYYFKVGLRWTWNRAPLLTFMFIQ